jgi:hypothetical protein
MTPTPLWKRQLRRLKWQRDQEGGVPRFSDYDPSMLVHQAANRIRQTKNQNLDRMRALLDRLDERDRERAERERAVRAARLDRRR